MIIIVLLFLLLSSGLSLDCTQFCLQQADGFYSHPSQCCSDSYCFCIGGRGSTAECEDWTMAFCEAYGTCIGRDDCLASSHGCCPNHQDVSTTPRPMDCSTFCYDQEDGDYSNSCCSSTYCSCNRGHGSLSTCPTDSAFCDATRDCVYQRQCDNSNEACCQ
jgi:hypothetical protein